MKVGQRVYNTLINRSGTIVAGPYLPDNGGFGLVVDVRWDKPYGNRTTIATRDLIPDER
jgi:hypothetical protein